MSGADPEMTHEMETIKTKMKAMWMAGDFGQLALYLEPEAVEFIARLGLSPGTNPKHMRLAQG